MGSQTSVWVEAQAAGLQDGGKKTAVLASDGAGQLQAMAEAAAVLKLPTYLMLPPHHLCTVSHFVVLNFMCTG